MRRLALAWALVLAAAAPSAQAPARLDGARADLDRFAGEWAGGYTCDDTGRHGTVVFRLAPGADSVWATVLMTPRATDNDPAPAPVPLAVHAVEVTGRSFRGVLASYEDPEWDIPLETEFGGALARDDHIEGYFRAVGTEVDTIPQCGRWWATRAADRKPSPTP